MQYRRRWVVGGVAAVVLATLVSGCGGGGGGGAVGPAPATVRGTVVDEMTRLPVAGARVRSGGRSAISATDGTFSVGVAVGGITITISASGYYSGNFRTTTTAGQVVELGAVAIGSTSAPPPAPF